MGALWAPDGAPDSSGKGGFVKIFDDKGVLADHSLTILGYKVSSGGFGF